MTTLCSEESYGRYYEPCVKLDYEIIKELLHRVYRDSLKEGGVSAEYILLNNSYITDNFPHIKDLVSKQVHLMTEASKSYSRSNNYCQNNRVM